MELSGLLKITVVLKQGWVNFLPCTEQSSGEMVLPVVGNKTLTLLFYNLKKGEMVESSRFGFMPWVHIKQEHHRPLERGIDGVLGAFIFCRIGFKLQVDQGREI